MTRTTRVARNSAGWTRGEAHDLVAHSQFAAHSVSEGVDQSDLNRKLGDLFAHQEWHGPVDIYIDDSATEHRSRGYWGKRAWQEMRQHDRAYRLSMERVADMVSTWERKNDIGLMERWHESFGALHQALVQVGVREDPDQKEREENLRKLEKSESQDDVLTVLEVAGFSRQVEQLRQHLVNKDAMLEDGEYPGIRFESLQAVSRFLISHCDLPFSAIRSDYDGNADLEWYLSPEREEGDEDDLFWVDGGGQIVLKFVTLNLVEFAMLSGPWLDGAERLSLSGTMSHSKMKIIIEMFIGRMVAYGEE